MGKLLLTSGQVSVLLSSTIVFTFTLLLFLAGYVLQQQTVHALQDTLKPRTPVNPNTPPPTYLAASLQSSPKFGGSLGSPGHAAFQSFLSPAQNPEDRQQPDWTKLAHVQLVKTHDAVCSSIMLFGELHRQRSPARRILLFPTAWAADPTPERGAIHDPFVMSTRRLLKLAARRYRVELRPISPLLEDANVDDETKYSLASVFAMRDVQRAMAVQTPGLLLDAEMLDAKLAFSPPSSLAVLGRDREKGVSGGEIVLISPGNDAFAALRASEAAAKVEDDVSFLTDALPEPTLVFDPEETASQESRVRLLKSISALHHVDSSSASDSSSFSSFQDTASFNATDFLATAAYIRFSDFKLPKGPEYDVPYADRRAARPKNKDADWLWTKLYGEFAQKRMEVCGLDLEAWREWE